MSLYNIFHKYFIDRNGRSPEADSHKNYDLKKSSDSFREQTDHKSDMRDFTLNFEQIFSEKKKHIDIKNSEALMKRKLKEMENLVEEFSHHINSFEPSNLPASEENQDLRDYYFERGSKNNPENEGTQKNHSERPPISSWTVKIEEKIVTFADGSEERTEIHTLSDGSSTISTSKSLPDGTVKTEETVTRSDGKKTDIYTLPDGSKAPNSSFSISASFKYPKTPEIKKIDPKDHTLKPGHDKFKPDDDKDKQTLQSGIECLPSLPTQPQIIEPPRPNELKYPISSSFRFSTKRNEFNIFTGRTECNEVVESEKITRYPDGTERRTNSQTFFDRSPLSRIVASGTFVIQGISGIIDVLLE